MTPETAEAWTMVVLNCAVGIALISLGGYFAYRLIRAMFDE